MLLLADTEEFKSLLRRRRYSHRTIEAYVFWLKEIGRYFPHIETAKLSETEAHAFLNHLQIKRKLSQASLRQAKSALDLYFKEIAKKDQNFSRFAINWSLQSPPKIPTQADILSILNKVKNTEYRLLLSCIYGMGLELNEALHLKVKNINIKHGVVDISQARHRGVRQALLPIKLQDDIKDLMVHKNQNDYLFTNKHGQPHSDRSLQKAFSKAKLASEINGNYSIRSLRHAFIKHLEFLGIPLHRIFEHMEFSKLTPIHVYNTFGYSDMDVTFSPIDRKIAVSEQAYEGNSLPFVSEHRITELSSLHSTCFDLTRLLALLRELNIAYKSNSFMAIAMLVRSIIDHVPPILGHRTFNEVSSNYSGSRSFRKSMEHLNNSLRNIADSHLHVPIRNSETLPTFTQVDFRADLDVLLSELVRIIK